MSSSIERVTIQTHPIPGSTLELDCAPASASSVACGSKLWSSAVVVVRFLALRGAEFLAERNVLELGAGMGLAGLVAARNAATVTCTDRDKRTLAHLTKNVQRNAGAFEVQVRSLDYSSLDNVEEFLEGSPPYEIVVATDVAYEPQAPRILWNAVDRLLSHAPDAVFIFAHKDKPLKGRNKRKFEEDLLQEGREHGFRVEHVELSALPKWEVVSDRFVCEMPIDERNHLWICRRTQASNEGTKVAKAAMRFLQSSPRKEIPPVRVPEYSTTPCGVQAQSPPAMQQACDSMSLKSIMSELSGECVKQACDSMSLKSIMSELSGECEQPADVEMTVNESEEPEVTEEPRNECQEPVVVAAAFDECQQPAVAEAAHCERQQPLVEACDESQQSLVTEVAHDERKQSVAAEAAQDECQQPAGVGATVDAREIQEPQNHRFHYCRSAMVSAGRSISSPAGIPMVSAGRASSSSAGTRQMLVPKWKPILQENRTLTGSMLQQDLLKQEERLHESQKRSYPSQGSPKAPTMKSFGETQLRRRRQPSVWKKRENVMADVVRGVFGDSEGLSGEELRARKLFQKLHSRLLRILTFLETAHANALNDDVDIPDRDEVEAFVKATIAWASPSRSNTEVIKKIAELDDRMAEILKQSAKEVPEHVHG